MDKYDFNFLKFRTDLIELLDKYQYELSGTCFDDGSMNICDTRSGKNYVISDSFSYYQMQDKDIMEEYILHFFEENKEKRLNNSKIGVFTNDRHKALNFFNSLKNDKQNKVSKYVNSKEWQELELADGTRYVWIMPNDGSRG